MLFIFVYCIRPLFYFYRQIYYLKFVAFLASNNLRSIFKLKEKKMSSELCDGMIVGMGNPLLDMSVVADEELLKKYELEANMACLAEEKHTPLYQELTEKYDVEYIAGGAVQNSLRVAQWLLQKPRVAVFMGSVGRDKFSDILKTKAEEDGVLTHYQYNDTVPTGTCAVVVTNNGSHRTLCANLAAANCFTPDHLEKTENKACLENAKFFYISGFFLTVSPESIMKVAKFALEKNKMFMMNLSAPFICQFFKEPQMKAFPYVDILFGNETEALAFAEAQEFGTTNIKEIALKIAALPKEGSQRSRMAVITQGHDPVLLAQGKIRFLWKNRFLSQLIQGKPIETCIRCGIWAASEIIQRSGCSFAGKPQFQE
ncbi:hypothetical protein B566_EDAN006543 [Ephemera danica]|nr:hypothetical protein B566_EDAN006543 [Ephemera danica]